jgi:predicted ATPase/DNA-binding CsgD family transcriptional regulator
MGGDTGGQRRDRASILPAGTMTFLAAGGTVAVFESASEAVAAALELVPGARRIALHTGEAHVRDDGTYTGPALRRCERLAELAGDGQILLSAQAVGAIGDALPAGVSRHDLGVHRLRDLSAPQRVFELRIGTVPDSGATGLRSLDAVPNNLPVQLTTFVGRAEELAAVGKLLTGERLVTITGAGGVGKTRLAAQAAAGAAERWPDGVWWVELAATTDPAAVPELVAAATGVLVEPAQGPVRSLSAQLRDHRSLVCLDNCEQVLDGAAEVAEALLRSCPEVTVLTTSREPLGVPGEAVWRVPSLAEDEALALFVERASLVRPWFTLDASSEAAVRTMCARLDGIPLALELAAAWLRTLTPQQIEAGLDDRFALLVRGPRGAVARQQTLAASIAWSHDLLDEPDRAVFRRLAVFGGGFTLDAARAVTGGSLDTLGRLVDKSLVVAEQRDGAIRYRMLETIREYAAGRLREAGEEAATRDRHLDHFLAIAETAEPELDRDKDAWRALVEPDRDNLRAALDWGLPADDPERGRRLAAALWWLWNLNGQGHEGIEVLRRAIGRAPRDRSPLQARLLTGIGLIADTTEPFDIDAVHRGLEIATDCGEARLRARCLALLALVRFYVDFDAAWALSEDAERAAEAAGDEFSVDAGRALRGIILYLRDRHDEAVRLLRAACAGLVRRADRGIASTAVGFASGSALFTGDVPAARRLAARAVAIAEPLGDYHRVGTTRSQLALLHGVAGDIEVGLRLMEPFLRLVEGAGTEVYVPGMARAMGTLRLWRGDLVEAVRWLEREAPASGPAADTYITALALPGLGEALRRLDRREDAAAVLDRAANLARRMDMPRVLADALEQQAHLATPEDPDRAADLHHEALALRVRHGLRLLWPDSLDALAALMAGTGRSADAVRVLAAAGAARDAMGCPRPPVAAPAHEETVVQARAALGDEAFAKARDDGARMTLDEVVAYVRRTRGARGRPSTGWASLTPTELDVVRLVVKGLNNPEIGARLFMSRGTVKTHLSHVYAKLGVANRTELATLASARLTRS